jgi:hypothetical protein
MKHDEQGKDWNEGHPDHEGVMAVTQLHRVAEMAQEMFEIIGKNDEIPGWIQYKISRAYNDLNDAYGYIELEGHSMGGVSLEKEPTTGFPMPVEEGKKKKRGLWDNIWARRRAGKRPKKPGEKGYPKTLDIEEAVLRRLLGK